MPRPPEPGVSFSLKLTGKRGAALVTRYKTYRQDLLKRGPFKKYAEKYYKSWVELSSDYGDDVPVTPVLVYGVDMTKDFAMTAYSNEKADITVSASMISSASGSVWGTWRTTGSPYTNCGPQYIPPPPAQTVDSPSGDESHNGQDSNGGGSSENRSSKNEVDTRRISPPQPTATETIPDDYNQCVFVRYYTMGYRFGYFPALIQASAGPHDLGSGQNHDSTFPELTAGQERASDVKHDAIGDHETQSSCSGDDGQPSVVVRNTPDV